MRPDFTGTPGTDWQLARGTYVFTGPPDDCRGQLTLVNLSAERIRVRRLQTRQPTRARKGFTSLDTTGIRLRVNLAPDSQENATAYLELPAETPPGQYLAQIVTGDHRATLEVHVEPYHLLEADPDEVELVARAGQVVSLRIALHNGGNLPVDIQQIAPVWLTEEDWTERILVSALQESDDAEDFGTFSRRLLEMARQDIPAPAQLTVEPSPAFTLDPGKTLDLALSLTLPDNLRTGRQYTGHIRISGERIGLEVYCSGQPAQRETSQPATHES